MVVTESELELFTEVEFGADGEVAKQAVSEGPGPVGNGVTGQGVNDIVIKAFGSQIPRLQLVIRGGEREGRIGKPFGDRKP